MQLRTEITPDLANMITIGATANGYVTGQDSTMLSNLNNGTTDRIKPTITSPNDGYGKQAEDNKSIDEIHNWYYSITDILLHNQNQLQSIKNINPYREVYSDIKEMYE